MVYLGIDGPSRAYLLGSLYDLVTSVSVEVTFVEDSFPFHKFDNKEKYAPLQSSLPAVFEPNVSVSVRPVLPTAARPVLPAPAPQPSDKPSTPSLASSSSVKSPEITPGLATRSQDIWKQALTDSVQSAPLAAPLPPTISARRSARLAASAFPILTDNVESEAALVTLTEASLDKFTPRNAHEAIHSPDSARWVAAMQREKDCHVKNQTFGHLVSDKAGESNPG